MVHDAWRPLVHQEHCRQVKSRQHAGPSPTPERGEYLLIEEEARPEFEVGQPLDGRLAESCLIALELQGKAQGVGQDRVPDCNDDCTRLCQLTSSSRSSPTPDVTMARVRRHAATNFELHQSPFERHNGNAVCRLIECAGGKRHANELGQALCLHFRHEICPIDLDGPGTNAELMGDRLVRVPRH